MIEKLGLRDIGKLAEWMLVEVVQAQSLST
jgi:hypothetical protein